MKLIKSDYHRNGITGVPFTIGIIKDEENNNKLIIQFEDKLEYSAVFDLDLLKQNIIEFGKNSFKSEYYADDFKILTDKEALIK